MRCDDGGAADEPHSVALPTEQPMLVHLQDQDKSLPGAEGQVTTIGRKLMLYSAYQPAKNQHLSDLNEINRTGVPIFPKN